MKKKFLILVLLIGFISFYVNLNKKDLKVNNLEKELGIQARKYAEEYFNSMTQVCFFLTIAMKNHCHY